LATIDNVKYWLKQLCEELVERMRRDKETNKRAAKLITVNFSFKEKDHNSKSLPIETYCDANKLADDILKQVFLKMKFEPIVSLSIAASKFVDDCDDPANNTSKLETYFTKVNKNDVNSNGFSFESHSCNAIKSKRFKNNETNNKSIKDFLNKNINKTEERKESDVIVIECNDSKNVSEVNDMYEDNDAVIIDIKSEKRGFFYRKMLEMELEMESKQ